MKKVLKTLMAVLRGSADNNIRFIELCNMLEYLGFEVRVRGDHHIFTIEGIPEIINLQPKKGKAKAYQVKQVRDLITTYRLAQENGHEE